jgi:hypothetical protein
MKLSIRMRAAVVVMTLLAVPLVVGSKCIFIASSGNDDNHKFIVKNQQTTTTAATATAMGTFTPATKGIAFVSGSMAGVTGDNGEFQYEEGKPVSFAIGDIALGAPVIGKPVISAADLAGSSSSDSVAAVNIERLLLSLDANPADDVVTIPNAVRTKAVRDNAAVASAIQFLDFADDTAFANAASQLVAVLTEDYPHTATLVDGEAVRATALRSPAL